MLINQPVTGLVSHQVSEAPHAVNSIKCSKLKSESHWNCLSFLFRIPQADKICAG